MHSFFGCFSNPLRRHQTDKRHAPTTFLASLVATANRRIWYQRHILPELDSKSGLGLETSSSTKPSFQHKKTKNLSIVEQKWTSKGAWKAKINNSSTLVLEITGMITWCWIWKSFNHFLEEMLNPFFALRKNFKRCGGSRLTKYAGETAFFSFFLFFCPNNAMSQTKNNKKK